MSKRPMTPIMSALYQMALRANLDHPLGRAARATNRHHNDSVPRHYDQDPACRCDECRMRRTRVETAVRWERHWLAGGSLKALCYRATEWNFIRRQRRAEKIAQGVVGI